MARLRAEDGDALRWRRPAARSGGASSMQRCHRPFGSSGVSLLGAAEARQSCPLVLGRGAGGRARRYRQATTGQDRCCSRIPARASGRTPSNLLSKLHYPARVHAHRPRAPTSLRRTREASVAESAGATTSRGASSSSRRLQPAHLRRQAGVTKRRRGGETRACFGRVVGDTRHRLRAVAERPAQARATESSAEDCGPRGRLSS